MLIEFIEDAGPLQYIGVLSLILLIGIPIVIAYRNRRIYITISVEDFESLKKDFGRGLTSIQRDVAWEKSGYAGKWVVWEGSVTGCTSDELGVVIPNHTGFKSGKYTFSNDFLSKKKKLALMPGTSAKVALYITAYNWLSDGFNIHTERAELVELAGVPLSRAVVSEGLDA